MTNTQQVNTSLNAGVAPPVPAPGNSTTGGGGSTPPITSAFPMGSPAGTTGAQKMMGLGTTWTFIPTQTGNLLINVAGMIQNAVAGNNGSVNIRVGTGAPPANGSIVTGTSVGALPTIACPVATTTYPWELTGKISGLALNVPVWIDISLTSVSGGLASIGPGFMTVQEVT